MLRCTNRVWLHQESIFVLESSLKTPRMIDYEVLGEVPISLIFPARSILYPFQQINQITYFQQVVPYH